MSWATCFFSRNAISRAGKLFIDPDLRGGDILDAVLVLSNWRAAHAYPMHALLIMLRNHARRVDTGAVVVQRLKRHPSIVGKLQRYPKMDLDRMQDIGGCRAIVATVADVEALRDRMVRSRTNHMLHRQYDYIASPKSSGYRGIHLTYKYNGAKKEYQGYFIEMQLRSKIQHSWATAVEIVDTFTKQALKSEMGSADWTAFFRMAAAEFAKLEDRPVGADVEGIDTKAELIRLANELKVIARLRAYVVSAKHIMDGQGNHTDFFLLEAGRSVGDKDQVGIAVSRYSTAQFEQAAEDYRQRELFAREGEYAVDVVLVAASSVHALRDAYPNYFGDSSEFIEYMQQAMAE